ncbi:MAG: PadR family transcriptional regulator [Chloroflexi bacterium]|nr:PadR family transcriptional regulator [Chloroflexota bacterium]
MPRESNTSPQTLRLLDLLLQESGAWWYGYDISRRTGLKPGTLYPLLIRLTEQGWLEASWEAPTHPGRPPRHTYRLTAEGRKEAMARVGGEAGAPTSLRLQGSETTR